MRRRAAAFLVAVFLALPALWLVAAADDPAAARCVIACGHATGAMKGAVCCPTTDARGSGPAFRTCAPGDGAALAPLPGQPAILVSLARLLRPDSSGPLLVPGGAAGLSFPPRTPDHVPLPPG